MKICYIVLVHHQPEVFHKLVNNICLENSDVIVHVDKRTDLKKFTPEKQKSIHFIKTRIKVHWSGWSLTEAILELLRTGLKISDADYFIYLAGTDFPIKSHQALVEFLASKYPANFINYYPLVPGIWGYSLIKRYCLIDLKANFIDPRYGDKGDESIIRNQLGRLVSGFEKLMNGFLSPRNTTWTNFYSGSSRWCLNRETVQYLVTYYGSKSSDKLKKYLKLAANSDEIFFQTAILNSPMKKYCTNFDEVESKEIFENKRQPFPSEKRVYFHYIDWNPEREDPAILDASDFTVLKKSDKYFASKFTDEISLELIKLLEDNHFS